jgi:hypothetical protein
MKPSTLLCVTIALVYLFAVSLIVLAICKSASKEIPSPCPPQDQEPLNETHLNEETEAFNP